MATVVGSPIPYRRPKRRATMLRKMFMNMGGVLETCYNIGTEPRQVQCLERAANSATLTIFLHGLGLDASDYVEYLCRHSERHSVAVTLSHVDTPADVATRPLGLQVQVELLSELINRLRRDSPNKKIIIVGFSLGADLILRLCEYWHDHADKSTELSGVILLDPNVNRSTMTISSVFAKANPNGPVPALKQLVAMLPDDDSALIANILSYLGKVARKDFAHIRQLSLDAVEYWQESGYEQFSERLSRVAKFSNDVRVVMSAPYEGHVPGIRASCERHGWRPNLKVLPGTDHFDLLDEQVLTAELSLIP